jgi:hypothetical protein
LEKFKTHQTHGYEDEDDGGEGETIQSGDAPEHATLMAEGNSAQQMLWINRTPLGAVNTGSIHQGGGTTRPVKDQPQVGCT